MIFNPGNMEICELCDNLRCELLDEHGEVFYCKLGRKIDSSQCEPFAGNSLALRVATAVGQALDFVDPTGKHDAVYEKERLLNRVEDALADYFNEAWTNDIGYELKVPGHHEMMAVIS